MSYRGKALALFSGGLDSQLSILWMKKLGYDVQPIFFESYFFSAKRAQEIASKSGFDLKVVDIREELIEVIKNPRYGFGKNMNPCVDCHSLMFRKAGELLESEKADFIISGEVLAQRPMSQRLDAMNAVAKYSGYKDFIIRPLSQKLLPETKPIKEGIVNKSELLDIQGRGRHRQLQLAKDFNISDFSNPGGGCSLTDKGFSNRLKDLIENEMLRADSINSLRYGRHFRLDRSVKLVVSRNENEILKLIEALPSGLMLSPEKVLGPFGIIDFQDELARETLELAACIVLSYTNKAKESDTIAFGYEEKFDKLIEANKLSSDTIASYIIKI